MEYLNRIISILYRHSQRYFTRAIQYRQLPVEVGHIPPLMQILRHNGITQEGICANTAMDKGTIARSVAQLVDLGLVRREADPEDRRVNHLYPTDCGMQLREPLFDIINDYHNKLYKGLTDAEVQQVNHLLRKILSNLTGSLPEDIPIHVQGNSSI